MKRRLEALVPPSMIEDLFKGCARKRVKVESTSAMRAQTTLYGDVSRKQFEALVKQTGATPAKHSSSFLSDVLNLYAADSQFLSEGVRPAIDTPVCLSVWCWSSEGK